MRDQDRLHIEGYVLFELKERVQFYKKSMGEVGRIIEQYVKNKER